MVEFNTHMDPKGVMVCDGGDFRWIYLSLKAKHVKDRCIKLASINPTCPSFCKIQNRPTGKKNTPSTRCHKMSGCIPWIYLSIVATIRPCFTCKKNDISTSKFVEETSTTGLNLPVNPLDTTPETPAGSLGRRCRPAGRHLKPQSSGAQGFPATNSDLSVTYLGKFYGLPIYIYIVL